MKKHILFLLLGLGLSFAGRAQQVTRPDSVAHCTPNGSSSSQTICQGETVDFDGDFLDSTGVYIDSMTNVGGCDSVVILNLTVNPITYDSLTPTICTGDTFYLNGNAYYRYGTYYDTLLNANGCDSIITTVLIVDQISYDTTQQAICVGDSAYFGG